MKIVKQFALTLCVFTGMSNSTVFANSSPLSFSRQPSVHAMPAKTDQHLIYTLSNNSAQSVHIDSIDVGPHDNPVYWTVNNQCPTDVAAGATCNIELILHAPASSGFINTALVVNYAQTSVLHSQPIQVEVYAAPIQVAVPAKTGQSVAQPVKASAKVTEPKEQTAKWDSNVPTPPIVPYQNATAVNRSGAQVTIYGGMSYISTAKSNIVLSQYETDKLVGGNNSTSFIPGLGAGYHFAFSPNQHFVQGAGVELDFFNDNFNRTGQVYQNELSQFNNYNYTTMDLNSARLMLNGEVDFRPIWHITFFAEAGVGGAYNYIKYTEKTQSGISGGELNMPGSYSTNFAYDVGGGVKIPLSSKLELSFRYLFTDAGSAKTGKTAEDLVTLEKPLNVDIKSNSWLFGITYLIQ